MKEYIFEIDGALVNEETGECVMHPTFKEELIRCKDCEFFHPRSVYGHGLCDVHCNSLGECEVVNEKYYCSWAERKEE